MKRRTFLGLGAAALASAGGLRRAFADTAADLVGVGLADGQRRAAISGKPLLVLIIPAERNQRWLRGHVLSSWLGHERDDLVAPLALTELVCAQATELRMAASPGEGEPLLAMIDGAEIHVARGSLDGKDEPLDALKVAEMAVKLIATVEEGRLARWEVQARAHLLPAETETLERSLRERVEPPSSLVDRAAAAVLRSRLPRELRRSWLARAVRARLSGRPPTGSRWAHDSSCGFVVEGIADDQQQMVDCGMGHIDGRSRRFLYLFTESPKDLH